MARSKISAVRLSVEEKALFSSVASGFGLTEAALLKRLVDGAVDPGRLGNQNFRESPPGVRSSKMLICLHPDVRIPLAERARARGLPAATYTDEPHPHVHVVLKAVNEQGWRLNIKKATLQEWRAKFAAHLLEQGVAANATPRRFRDQPVRATPHALLHQRAREQLVRSLGRESALFSRVPASEGEGSGALHKNLDSGRPNNLETGMRNNVVWSRVGHAGDRRIAESFESGKVRNPCKRKTPCLPK
jgi:transposase-like protein